LAGQRNNISCVDLVIPVYNEEMAVAAFHKQLLEVIDPLPFHFNIIYVNDGSSDATGSCLEEFAACDPRVTVIELSRNFGHQAALTAGLDHAVGDTVISMDGDGQNPPALIPEMLNLAQSGYDVVLTQRMAQQDIPPFKRWTSTAFYTLTNRIADIHIPPDVADFRLLTKPVVEALRGMHEYHRFLRCMVAWMGFRTVILPFTPPERLAGTTKYSLRKMVRLGLDAIFSFSLIPLYIGITIGILFLLLAGIEAAYVISFWISGRTADLARGWSSLMFVLLIVGGSLMICLGFIGIYIGYIFQEVKRRPIYLVRQKINANPPAKKVS
jgi:glycosyltransferase involved in cell wall biosynthesis